LSEKKKKIAWGKKRKSLTNRKSQGIQITKKAKRQFKKGKAGGRKTAQPAVGRRILKRKRIENLSTRGCPRRTVTVKPRENHLGRRGATTAG